MKTRRSSEEDLEYHFYCDEAEERPSDSTSVISAHTPAPPLQETNVFNDECMIFDLEFPDSISSPEISQSESEQEIKKASTPHMKPVRLHELLSKLQIEYKNTHPAKKQIALLSPKKMNCKILDDFVRTSFLLAESYKLMESLNQNNKRHTLGVKRDFDNLMIKLQDEFTTKAMAYCNKKKPLRLFPKPKNLNTSVAEFITTINIEPKKHTLYRGIGLILQEYYEAETRAPAPHNFSYLRDSHHLRTENSHKNNKPLK